MVRRRDQVDAPPVGLGRQVEQPAVVAVVEALGAEDVQSDPHVFLSSYP